MSLAQRFAAYARWRSQLGDKLQAFRRRLAENELDDARSDLRLARLAERLREDSLHVAFVAEFSRDKSELINALFFADYGKRMLPSSAGRTTMCPTELLFDPAKPPCIELLPIGTRAGGSNVSEVDRRTAESLGFAVEGSSLAALPVGDHGLVEIPRWRHALINFPHPLLQRGLVVLDTPGLNAIGSEPELTLSLLPNAHAVLFVLAADSGVTQSDLAIWRQHVGAPDGCRKGWLVVLNKIDGLWDGLKTDSEIDELGTQTRALLESRLADLRQRLAELRGRNKGTVDYMIGKAQAEKAEFEAGLRHYQATRSVFSALANRLFTHLGPDALRGLTQSTRTAMPAANFSKQLSAAGSR